METGKRILELQNQLRNSGQYKRIRQIEQLSLSLAIFRKNAAELRHAIELSQHPQFAIKLTAAMNRHLFTLFFHEVIRFFHNFVAASSSLIDHERRLYRKSYDTHPSFRDYDQEKQRRFRNDPLCRFIQGLRDYTLHRAVPYVGSLVSIIPGENFVHTLFLNRDELLEWDKWPGPAKGFLRNSNKQIDLYRLIVDYETKIRDFYDWYYARLREAYQKDLLYVNTKQDELRRLEGLELPRHLEAELRRGEKTQSPLEEMFVEYIDNETFYHLTQPSTEPAARAKKLLDHVSKYSTIPENLQNRVIDTFVKYYSGKKAS